MTIKDEIKKIRDNVYEIPGSYNKQMRASGRLYIDDESFNVTNHYKYVLSALFNSAATYSLFEK